MEPLMGHIYKLKFESGDFYIGQTSNLEVRIYNHLLNKGKGSPKLQKAFANDKYAGYEVLAEVEDSELNSTEMKLITELNPALNTLPGGEGLRGLNHPKSKYTKEQLLESCRLYIETDLVVEDISAITDVQKATIFDMVNRRSHDWIQEYYSPEILDQAVQNRKPKGGVVYDINNNKYTITTTYSDFEKEHGLFPGAISGVIRLNKARTDGWSATPHKVYKVCSPDGDEAELTEPLARVLFKESGLSQYQIARLLKNKDSAGWKCKHITLEKFES